jgi:preprotein translocase subunit SecD
MTSSIRNRLLIIGALVALSVYSLFPREVTIRTRGPDGAMRDTTETRVPLKRGLDLQGGMHLGLELDQSNRVSSDVARDIDLALTVLRKRVDEFGVQEPVVQKVGDERIVVELAGVRDPQRAMDIVQKAAFLEFRITDRTSALDKALPAMDRALRGLGVTAAAGKTSPSAVQSLLGGDSAAEGSDSTPVEGGALSSLIQPGASAGSAVPGEYFVPEAAYPRVDSLLRIPEVARTLPRGVEILWTAAPISVGVQPYRFFYVVEEKPIVTGRNLVDASAQFDQLTNGPVVLFELDRAGGRQFGAATQAHIGDYMAIVLDGRIQGAPPVIQGRIDRNGQITMGGGKSIVEAQDLALTLKAGALPVPLKIVERFQVGASLGADSIRGGITAGLVGTLVVILIMIGYYRLSGVLAVAGLTLYLLFTLGGLAMLDATLTLPGLAGIVLSIGIAVDANVLIFERIREELVHGRTVRLAVDEGFQHAMSAIIDSNVSTVITALFLFQFGTGPVKGFAVTLTMGIIASMITAVFVTRTFFMIWLQRRPDLTTLSI